MRQVLLPCYVRRCPTPVLRLQEIAQRDPVRPEAIAIEALELTVEVAKCVATRHSRLPLRKTTKDVDMYKALRDEARWVLPEVLQFQARECPNETFIISSATGETLTFAQAADDADRVAGMFAATWHRTARNGSSDAPQ